MCSSDLREAIREALGVVPAGKLCTTEMLTKSAARIVIFEVTEADLQEAIEWNQSKGFIDYKWDSDSEVDSWFLTERGRAKK